MVKVRALMHYQDFKLNRHIDLGEIYEVDNDRAKVLLAGNETNNFKPFVEVVEEVVETADINTNSEMPIVEKAVKPRKKKTTKE